MGKLHWIRDLWLLRLAFWWSENEGAWSNTYWEIWTDHWLVKILVWWVFVLINNVGKDTITMQIWDISFVENCLSLGLLWMLSTETRDTREEERVLTLARSYEGGGEHFYRPETNLYTHKTIASSSADLIWETVREWWQVLVFMDGRQDAAISEECA